MRPRKAPITSRNFAAMAAFHNYPAGRATGNHWGEALTMLHDQRALALSLLAARERPGDPDGGSRKDTGHTFICGPTGSGKTVFIGFLIAMLSRQGATQVVFDKDRGLEILVRALGGEYLPLRNGMPPASIRCSCRNAGSRGISEELAAQLWSRPGTSRALGTRQQADLDQALRGTLALQPAARRLSRLIEFLDPTDPEGIHARLARWCASTQGDYAWVFDNAEDRVVPRLSGRSRSSASMSPSFSIMN
jgi:type IV secretion system protein VirB4